MHRSIVTSSDSSSRVRMPFRAEPRAARPITEKAIGHRDLLVTLCRLSCWCASTIVIHGATFRIEITCFLAMQLCHFA